MRELAEHDPNRIVIVDAPPLHAGTEAGVLARMVGHVVVLVEADKTPQASVADALHQLKGCESVSMVLNKARRRSSDHVRITDTATATEAKGASADVQGVLWTDREAVSAVAGCTVLLSE